MSKTNMSQPLVHCHPNLGLYFRPKVAAWRHRPTLWFSLTDRCL